MPKINCQHWNHKFRVQHSGNVLILIQVSLGWSIDLQSQLNGEDIEWQVFIGPPNLEYPTYSSTIKHDYLTLQPFTETFVTFALEHETLLKKRGLFQFKKYCSEDIILEESVTCYKRCYLEKINVH